jgi:hypothetical protein
LDIRLKVLTVALVVASDLPAFAVKPTPDSEIAKFEAAYPLTHVGQQFVKVDYNRITQPGAMLNVRVQGIYAIYANTTEAIVNSEVENGQVHQQRGFLAALSDTRGSRQLRVDETVYVTRIDANMKRETLHFEVITAEPTLLSDGETTRYRSEIVFHIPGLESATSEQLKAIVDQVIADASIAHAAKTVELGMTAEQVKGSLGIPENIIRLGQKEIFVYHNMKVIFIDGRVADVQ